MKKALKIVFFLVVAVALGYYAYATYQHTASVKGVVHQDADAILKIGLQDIAETLALDALTAPNYYLKNSKRRKTTTENETIDREMGVALTPHNLLLFSLPDIANTWFTTLTIQDKSAFEDYLQQRFKERISLVKTKASFTMAKENSSRSLLGWNGEKLIVAVGPALVMEQVAHVFEELLTQGKFSVDTNEGLLEKAKETEGHLVFVDSTGATSIRFVDGRAVVVGSHTTDTSFPTEALIPEFDKASFNVHYHQKFLSEKERKGLAKRLSPASFFAKNNLSWDSIANPLNGAISMAIKGRVLQTDTVITYAYNDNFEKVPQKTATQNQVPRVHIRAQTRAKGVLAYLDRTQTLTAEQIFTPFPLYQLQVREYEGHVDISTDHQAQDMGTKRSSYFFQIRANFKNLQEDLAIPQTQPLFSLLDNMDIHAWQPQENNIRIEGTVSGRNPEVNILSQIFFGLRHNDHDSFQAEL